MSGDPGSSDRFSREWTTYREILPTYEGQFRRWVHPLSPESFRGRSVLDAGCGTGRNSYWPLLYGASQVEAFDAAPETVEVARRNLASFPNATVRCGSIYDLDERDRYDIVLCIGVIHHLERPREAVRRLFDAVRPGGTLLLWVYGYEGNEWIVRCVNPLRAVASRLPYGVVDPLARALSLPLHLWAKAAGRRHPYFRALGGFSLRHVHSIVVDQLIPRIARYWKRDEALALLEGIPATGVAAHRVNRNSWTVTGTKPLSGI